MTEGEACPGSGQVGKAGEASPCHTRAERMAEDEARPGKNISLCGCAKAGNVSCPAVQGQNAWRKVRRALRHEASFFCKCTHNPHRIKVDNPLGKKAFSRKAI